jgi:predicted secreted protein with PEFG-CTERM motif
MIIPLYKDSKEITITGIKVIPEFGSIAVMIMVVGIISIVLVSKSKHFTKMPY